VAGLKREVYIGFGSNLGDRCALINQALAAVAELPQSRLVRLSSLYETAPVGYLDQGAFLNGVAQLVSTLSPAQLLAGLLGLENELGRVRLKRWGPRTIDLDILLIGDEVIDEKDLTVPHPEMVNRLFVLEPLAEIAPGLLHPVKLLEIIAILNQYRETHPAEEAAVVVADPPGVLSEESDGIFYRYRQS
jgi:2-amino-4-hydroxy-6-hydroxymethyldihydropteridine diphosphokinase